MSNRLKTLFALLLISFSFSCSKNDVGDDKKEIIEIPDPVTDVYAVGYESNGIIDIAKIWKNGEATNLTDGTNKTFATSVFVTQN
jgi:hypothetical protein